MNSFTQLQRISYTYSLITPQAPISRFCVNLIICSVSTPHMRICYKEKGIYFYPLKAMPYIHFKTFYIVQLLRQLLCSFYSTCTLIHLLIFSLSSWWGVYHRVGQCHRGHPRTRQMVLGSPFLQSWCKWHNNLNISLHGFFNFLSSCHDLTFIQESFISWKSSWVDLYPENFFKLSSKHLVECVLMLV